MRGKKPERRAGVPLVVAIMMTLRMAREMTEPAIASENAAPSERRASGGEAQTRAAAGETLAKRSQTETSGVTGIGIETEMIAALNVVIEIAVTTENKESHLEIRMMEALGVVLVKINPRSGTESAQGRGRGSEMLIQKGAGVRTKTALVAQRTRPMTTVGPLSAAESQLKSR